MKRRYFAKVELEWNPYKKKKKMKTKGDMKKITTER